MKYMKLLLVTTCAFSCMGMLSVAVGEVPVQQTVNNKEAQLERLESQLVSLQKEVKRLKVDVRQQNVKTARQAKEVQQTKNAVQQTKDAQAEQAKAIAKATESAGKIHSISVSMIPYPAAKGPGEAYATGANSLVNYVSINPDEELLQFRRAEGNTDYPHVYLGGKIAGKATYDEMYSDVHTNDVTLSGVNLDTLVEVNDWTAGYVDLSYDDALLGSKQRSIASQRRIDNANFFVDKAYITIGNFNKSPVYGSIGQFYMPFGRYTTLNISDPLTTMLSKTKARGVVLSYADQDGAVKPYAHLFWFNGDSVYPRNRETRTVAKQGGLDLGTDIKAGAVDFDMGGSYIRSLADSMSMQNNGASTGFRGFSASSAAERLVHPVGGAGAHAHMVYDSLTLCAEYITALQEFSERDLTFNSHGAKPRALDLEALYGFQMFKHSMILNLGYGHSRQALALNMPRDRYLATLIFTLLDNTELSLEYRHDVNYKKGTTAGGNDTSYVDNYLGKHDNAVTAQISMYF